MTEDKLTLEESEEIIEIRNKFENISCSCHINPPCSKCENSHDEELIAKAEEIILKSDKRCNLNG